MSAGAWLPSGRPLWGSSSGSDPVPSSTAVEVCAGDDRLFPSASRCRPDELWSGCPLKRSGFGLDSVFLSETAPCQVDGSVEVPVDDQPAGPADIVPFGELQGLFHLAAS